MKDADLAKKPINVLTVRVKIVMFCVMAYGGPASVNKTKDLLAEAEFHCLRTTGNGTQPWVE